MLKAVILTQCSLGNYILSLPMNIHLIPSDIPVTLITLGMPLISLPVSGSWDSCVCLLPLRKVVKIGETMLLKDLFGRTMPHKSHFLTRVVILVLIYFSSSTECWQFFSDKSYWVTMCLNTQLQIEFCIIKLMMIWGIKLIYSSYSWKFASSLLPWTYTGVISS